MLFLISVVLLPKRERTNKKISQKRMLQEKCCIFPKLFTHFIFMFYTFKQSSDLKSDKSRLEVIIRYSICSQNSSCTIDKCEILCLTFKTEDVYG